jgi:plastocyanin
MPFTWQININKFPGGAGAYAWDPNPLSQVATGDQIIWTNNDDKPHWPGITGNPTYFMANQIAPNSPSATFVPGVDGTITYADSLDPGGPTGTIVVGDTTLLSNVVLDQEVV